MVALHYLKYTFNRSDEDVVEVWVENPYWQLFSGNQYFEHSKPIDPTSMTRFRNRSGEAGAEELLNETIAAGLKLKAISPHQLKRVNVDTTVQEKEVLYPNYNRTAKHQLLMSHRYAHARQMNRARKGTRKLRTLLGRVIRNLERKAPVIDDELRNLLDVARLSVFLRPVLAHLFEVLKQVLRTLRSEIFSSNHPDPVFAVL